MQPSPSESAKMKQHQPETLNGIQRAQQAPPVNPTTTYLKLH